MKYTLDQVREHSYKTDCWIVIKGKVYNVTPFLLDHPGGPEIIYQNGGKDVTEEFHDTNHSPEAIAKLPKYEIGELDAPADYVTKVKLTHSQAAEEERIKPDLVVALCAVVGVVSALVMSAS